MSLFLSERWRIVLCPDAWARVRLNRAGKAKAPAEYLPLEGGDLLSGVERWLMDLPRARRRLEFRLSNHLCRFACVPWAEGVRSEADLEFAAAAALEPLLVGGTESWEIRLSPVRFGRACLASAIPGGLHADLKRMLAAARVELVSLSPVLPFAYAHWLEKVSADQSAILLCAEGSHFWALSMLNDEPQWIRGLSDVQNAEEIPAFLLRQQRLAAQPETFQTYMTAYGSSEALLAFASRDSKLHLPAAHPALAMLEDASE